MDELEKEGRGVIESERIPALFYINIWTRLRWEDDELGVGSPEHSGSREMDWIPADRVLLNEPVLVWILEGRQYCDWPRNAIQSDFRFIYRAIRTTLYKKSPVKVADNRPTFPPFNRFTPFSPPSPSPLKSDPAQFGLISRQTRWNKITIVRENFFDP